MPDLPRSPKRLWSHKETAGYLNISPNSLYLLNSRGGGPPRIKIGRVCRYDPDLVVRWVESRAVSGAVA